MESREELRQRIRDAYDELLKDRTIIQDKRDSLIKAMRKTYSEEENMAIYLHSVLCHFNHTDICSWYYEMKNDGLEDDFSKYTHEKYLEKARAVIRAGYSIEDVKKIFNAINSN